MSAHSYLQQVSEALNNFDADSISQLLSFGDDHVTNPKIQMHSPESICQRLIQIASYDELFAAHMRGCWALANKDYKQVFACQLAAVSSFVKALQADKDDNWALPIMYTLVLDLRFIANKVEENSSKNKETDTFEKAADSIMSCFRICGSDGRAALEVSKRWGMQFLVNQLFKVYFRIGKLHLLKPLIRAIESSNIKEEFPLAQRVTYKYFVGRKAMFDSDYKLAESYLEFAFTNCHREKRNNLRLILLYLVPVKMLLGRMPPRELLERHNLSEYVDVAQAVKVGNVAMLNNALSENELFFIQTGTYLILEKLRAITFRTLFRKVGRILDTHLIPLQRFVTVLQAQGITDIDMDEMECIVAGLIYGGSIRGYISHQHKTLVVSKVNAFPSLAAA